MRKQRPRVVKKLVYDYIVTAWDSWDFHSDLQNYNCSSGFPGNTSHLVVDAAMEPTRATCTTLGAWGNRWNPTARRLLDLGLEGNQIRMKSQLPLHHSTPKIYSKLLIWVMCHHLSWISQVWPLDTCTSCMPVAYISPLLEWVHAQH